MERSRKIDPEVDCLLDELLVLTKRLEMRLDEIEEEVGGFGRRSNDEDSDDPERRANGPIGP